MGIIVIEYAVIVALLWALSLEYQSNPFMRGWIDQNARPLAYLLNGYFAALLLGVLIGSLGMYARRFLQKKSASGKPRG